MITKVELTKEELETKRTKEIGFAAKMVEWYDNVNNTRYEHSLTTYELLDLSKLLQAQIDKCTEHINFFAVLEEFLKGKYHPQANFFSGTYIEYNTCDLGCSHWASHNDFYYDIFLIFYEAVDVPWDIEPKFERIVYEVATNKILSDAEVAYKIRYKINELRPDVMVMSVFVKERKEDS